MTRAYGAHESTRALTTTWLTPPAIFEPLGPFDLDPCAHPDWPTAERRIVLPEDGLAAEWEGRVWLNPPYSSEAWVWLERLAEHGSGTALIFARTETRGFRTQVWEKADSLLFLHGRLKFHLPDGSVAKGGAGAPSVLVAYSAFDSFRLRTSGLSGTFVSNLEAVA